MSTQVPHKYAHLPDIDTESPETFENVVSEPAVFGGLVGMDNDENSDIDAGPLHMAEAADKFKGTSNSKKTFCSQGHLYQEETRAQRINRLVVEVYELSKEMESETETKDRDSSRLQLERLEEQLRLLSQRQFTETDGYGQKESINDLVFALQQLQTGSTGQTNSTTAPGTLENPERKPTYELFMNPSTLKLLDSLKLTDFETRISQLEKILGSSATQLHEQPIRGNVMSILQRLDSKMNLLSDPITQDRLLHRLRSLNALAAQNPSLFASDKKLDALYETLQSPALSLVPNLVSRFVALKDIHNSAASMTKSLSTLETRLDSEHRSNVEIQKAIETLQGTIKSNSDGIMNNVAILQDRIQTLSEKIGKRAS